MLIKNAPLTPAKNNFGKGSGYEVKFKRATLEIPFDQMDKDDAYRIDMDSPECDMTYNLIRQRCFRASVGKKKFLSRKDGQMVMIHRTA